jgi:hypothetical protein
MRAAILMTLVLAAGAASAETDLTTLRGQVSCPGDAPPG